MPRYTAIVNILHDRREVPLTVTLCGYLYGNTNQRVGCYHAQVTGGGAGVDRSRGGGKGASLGNKSVSLQKENYGLNVLIRKQ